MEVYKQQATQFSGDYQDKIQYRSIALPYTMAVWGHLLITSKYCTYDLKFIERVPCINTCSSVWENVIIPRNAKR